MRRIKKVSLAVSIIIGIVVMIYAGALLVLQFWVPVPMDDWFRPRQHKPFSKETWGSSGFGDSIRYEMANDLLRSRQLLGKTKDDLKALLGDPKWEQTVGSSTILGYDLVPQISYPARCPLLPSKVFFNIETWV